MSSNNDFSGEITITPPLTASEIRWFTALRDVNESFDVHLRINTDSVDTPTGTVVTESSDAILGPDEACNGYEVQEQIQELVDLYRDGHVFTGFIELDPDPGYGDPTPSRFVVRDGRVVEIKPQLVWPDEPAPAPVDDVPDSHPYAGAIRELRALAEFDRAEREAGRHWLDNENGDD